MTGERADNGGVAARRAVVRWAWRLFRREWRQQFLVLALLAVAVARSLWVAVAQSTAPWQAGRSSSRRRRGGGGRVPGDLSLIHI